LSIDLMSFGFGTESGARGKGVNIAVIENAAYVDHEDLNVTTEDGQTIWLNQQLTDPAHGTAVLGIMLARNQANPKGMVGIAHDSKGHFFPSFSIEEGPRFFDAVASAIITLEIGDIICFSIGPENENTDGDCNVGVLTSGFTNWLLVRLARDAGILSVISIGNDCCNVDDTPEAGGSSGAMYVGGADPGRPFCRRPESNHSEEGGPIPQMSGWGATVATLGGTGELFGSIGDVNRQYTASFDGTSAAAPMVAGGIACVQGMANQYFGLKLMPGQLLSGFQGTPQCEISDEDDLPGSDDGDECLGDTSDPGELPPNQIGLFPDLLGWSQNLIQTPFFNGSPLLDDVLFINGTHHFGNDLALRAVDGLQFVGESRFTLAGEAPSSNMAVPQHFPIDLGTIGEIRYIANGQIADFVAAFTVPSENVSAMSLFLLGTSTNQGGFLFFEAYDWTQGRFQFLNFVQGYEFLAPAGLLNFPLPRARRFINQSTKQVIVRVWTFGFASNGVGAGGGGDPDLGTFFDRWEFIDLNVATGFGVDPF
jgi:hypothetical protein